MDKTAIISNHIHERISIEKKRKDRKIVIHDKDVMRKSMEARDGFF